MLALPERTLSSGTFQAFYKEPVRGADQTPAARHRPVLPVWSPARGGNLGPDRRHGVLQGHGRRPIKSSGLAGPLEYSEGLPDHWVVL